MCPDREASKTSCDRCGSCCLQGGPALHGGDLHLIHEGALAIGDLVTIRKGELAYQPMAETPSPVEAEFLKIGGRPGSWACRFYDEPGRACTVYGNRPLACGLFDCTAPEAILRITGQDLLTRFSCVDHDEPLVSIAREHEEQYPCPNLAMIVSQLKDGRQKEDVLARLTPLVNDDLNFRRRVARQRQLSIGEELFWFGRPLFQLLEPLGIQIQETVSGLRLS